MVLLHCTAGGGGGGGGAAEELGWARVVPATVHREVRPVHAVQPGARHRAAGHAGDHRVLPGGLAVQVRQQTLHPLINP